MPLNRIPTLNRVPSVVSRNSVWDRHLRAHLGRGLRVMFQNSLEGPVPEHVTRVLRQMEQAVPKEHPRDRKTE